MLYWLRWEFGRRIEVTPGIRLITIERFIKAFVLVAGGIIFLVLSSRTDLHRLAMEMQTQLNLSPGRGWVRHLYSAVLSRLGSLSTHQQHALGAAAILYGLLEAFEGVGLVLRRRWAEYLVLVATVVFLPVEIDELAHHATAFKAGALLINLIIIAYLVWRKRLFLDRPNKAQQSPLEPLPS